MSQIENNILVQRIRNGDEAAFAELVELYSKKLYYLCLKILQNPSDAEDAVQNVFVRVYTNVAKFQEKSSISTWLYRIAVNLCNDALRKRKREAIVPLYGGDEESYGYTSDIEDKGADLEGEVIENERKRALYRALSELKPRHRDLIALRDLEGLSYDEISKITKTNVGTVKSGISRARRALLEKLQENKELFS